METSIIQNIGNGIVGLVKLVLGLVAKFINSIGGDFSDLIILGFGIGLAYALFRYGFDKWRKDWLMYLIVGFFIYLMIKLAGG